MIQVFNYIDDIQKFLKSEREKGCSVGFVPTMGALHEGHLSLVRRAKKENDIVAVSVFVNPVQFNNPTDFEKYPRTLNKDIVMLQDAGCDVVFAPSEKEMYPAPVNDKYSFGELENVMEGVCRPGHFNGVAIVVRKFFDIVMPDRAYFGEKDFQQLAIIRKLVADFSFDINIVSCDIVRENDGLAMSSRNMRLSPQERAVAPLIFKVLSEVTALKDRLSHEEMQQLALQKNADNKDFDVEYVEIADETSLKSINSWDCCEHARIFVAMQLGPVRLIDNLRIF